ncbi:unnamed protein product, partial [Iphiclides podalirius]
MSKTFTGDKRESLNAVESENIKTDSLEEIKSKIINEDKVCRDIDNKKKMISKNIQVDFKEELPDGGIVFDLKYEMYWQELAESKRLELEEALEENERLCKLKETLIKENIHYQKLLEEASSFVEVLKEVVQESSDDTGIDVRDVNDSHDE